MDKHKPCSYLRVVDDLIQNFRLIGYDLDEKAIRFVWKIVEGGASEAEVNMWKRDAMQAFKASRKMQFSDRSLTDEHLIAAISAVAPLVKDLETKLVKVNGALSIFARSQAAK